MNKNDRSRHASTSQYAGPSSTYVEVGPLDLWFSYSTLIAFRIAGSKPVVRENIWGATTGKHMNAIDDGNKAARIDGSEFENRMDEAMGGVFASNQS